MRTTTMLPGALVLALMLGPGAVLAQSSDTADLPTPAHWTGIGNEVSGPNFAVPDTELGFFPWGYRTTMGITYTVQADDPRASGDLAIVFVRDWSDKHDLGRGSGLSRLVNEGGSFEGPVDVMYYPDGSEFRMALMEGHGGYEGLTYSMTNYIDPTGNGQPQGLIWEGDMPSLPGAELLPD